MPTLTQRQRDLIGKESAPRPAPYAVNEAMAQHWCEMVEDANPIYFDEAYARTTWLQGRFAPPAMIFTWGRQLLWPEPESEGGAVGALQLDGCTNTIAVNAIQEYHLPIRYGDAITVTNKLSDVSDEKTTRLGAGHFVTTTETFRNQLGQVVGTHTFTLFTYKRLERLSMAAKAWKAGDALESESLPLTLRRSVQAVGATRDYYPVHHDVEFAQGSGVEGLFFNTMFLQAFVGRVVCEWFGNDAFLRRLEIAMRGPNYVGKTLSASGAVTATRESNGCHLVDADVTLSTEDGPTTDVKITVQLPVDVMPDMDSR